MGFLFAKSKNVVPEFTGLQVNTAVNALAVPLVYGCPRITWNIMYANGFTATPIKQSSGGKGLLTGGKGQTTGYKYNVTLLGALGEGIIDAPIVIFDDAQVYTLSTIPSGSGKAYTFFDGGGDNALPWGVVTATWPSDAFAYPNTAYLACDNYPLDSSGTIPQLGFVCQGRYMATSPLNLYTAPDGSTWYLDADPSEVIYDFLTNADYGAGFPIALLDYINTLFTTADGFNPVIGDATVSTYCQAIGLAWSVVLNNTEPASSVLDRWCKNLVVAPVWTGAILKFIPYFDSTSNTNPGWSAGAGVALKYYTPDITPLFDLTDDDFLQPEKGEDPIVITRVDPADARNYFKINFRDRFNLFNDNLAEASDENQIELYGPRVDKMSEADEFTLIAYAAVSAQLQLQRSIAIRNTFTWKLSWVWAFLDPMDIVTLSDEIIGLNKFPVRITSIEEDEKGLLTFIAEEFPIGAASATMYSRQNNAPPQTFLTNAIPGAVNTPFIFEPTLAMLTAQGLTTPTVAVGASGGPAGTFDPNWGGCQVYISNDNITYSELPKNINEPSRMGVTTATLNAFSSANPDNTNTLSVNISESNGILDTVTSESAAAGVTLCAIMDSAGELELLSYTTATLTSAGHYNLTGLYRGLYGTVACAKASGSQFLRVDSSTFEVSLPPAFIGVPLYVKLPSFNTYNNELQDLSTCTVYNYTPIGSGSSLFLDPIISALLAGTGADLQIADDPLAPIDLNLGGTGSCAPVILSIDLGTS